MLLITSLIILEIIIFAVLIHVFRKIMAQNVVSATQHLEELNQDFGKKEEELTKQIETARQEAAAIVKAAHEDADRLKNDILKKAESESTTQLEETRKQCLDMVSQAEKSRQQLVSEIQERISKEAVMKACELLAESLPEEFKKAVHSEWVEDLIKQGFAQLERIRIPVDITEATIVTAYALKDSEKNQIQSKLKEAMKREFAIKEEINPLVVAGISIHVASVVIDGTLKNKIQQKSHQ